MFIKNKLKLNNLSYKYDYKNYYSIKKKFIKYEKKGIPIRITIGEKELLNKTIEVFRRDKYMKYNIYYKKFIKNIIKTLNKIQKNLYLKHKLSFKKNIINIKNIKNITNKKKKK
ncbi:MAG: His/Gly/Thr/Pro-type tRNA ligase C-terminal domain-containing protein [Candidatus Shikimatogenerans sp. Tser]|uniref:His/Gly/Thr/Pro-type tRNA ligase C-terminal domain-containing protein n=1 Tax=Candidatus Shikimatogenerans sp. Tser TaxID=3158568 RepID=A0AAU7QRH9_9FLAO